MCARMYILPHKASSTVKWYTTVLIVQSPESYVGELFLLLNEEETLKRNKKNKETGGPTNVGLGFAP